MKPDKTEPIAKLQTCLKDIKTWMSTKFLLLNSDKTEFIVFGPKTPEEWISQFFVNLQYNCEKPLSYFQLGYVV